MLKDRLEFSICVLSKKSNNILSLHIVIFMNVYECIIIDRLGGFRTYLHYFMFCEDICFLTWTLIFSRKKSSRHFVWNWIRSFLEFHFYSGNCVCSIINHKLWYLLNTSLRLSGLCTFVRQSNLCMFLKLRYKHSHDKGKMYTFLLIRCDR